MSLKEEKTKAFDVHACRGARDGRQERDAVIVRVSFVVFVKFPIRTFVEQIVCHQPLAALVCCSQSVC